MTNRFFNSLSAVLVATIVSSTALPGTAVAGGSISLSYTPAHADEARALQRGFQLYSLYKGLKNGANIRQYGRNNAAGIAQSGSGNRGIIHQKGSGHSATLQQHGNRNSYGIFQFGRNTSANVAQYGNGQAGATFLFGW